MNSLTKITIAGLVALGISGAGLAVAQTATESSATATIGFDEVSAIALEAQPGTVMEIEREHEDGKHLFEVEIATDDGEVEVMIDAITGEVLSVEPEDDGWGFWRKDGGDEKTKG